MLPLAFLATSCGSSTPSGVEPAALREPPPSLALACDGPVALAGEGLTGAETARLWALDRGRLAICRARHAALARFYRARDAGIAGRDAEGGT